MPASAGVSSDAPAASASTDTASITSARSGIRKAKRRRYACSKASRIAPIAAGAGPSSGSGQLSAVSVP